jgi:hypothetical protein
VGNNEYKSHLLTRDPIRSDQSVKETLFTGQQMHLISALASLVPRRDIRQEIHDEVLHINQRKALHEQSQQRIKTWGNTIMGSRKKRLAAAKDKAEREEV